MKNIKIIFSISLIVIGMCLISSGILLIYKNEEKKSENQKISHINKENGSFHCTRETFEMQNYKIDYQYDFSFTDGKVNRASTLYIYTFKTKESYELFHINFSDIGLETEEDFDNKSLTKKYTTHAIFEEYAEDVNQYLSYMQETGYVCEEK